MAEYIVREIDYLGSTKRKVLGELVYCRNCKYYEEEDFFCHYWENLYAYNEDYPKITSFDFCSRAIRKDEARND